MKGDEYISSYEESVIYFSVPTIQETLNKISASGRKVILPKTSIGEYGFIAHFGDCEGNRAALHYMSQNIKSFITSLLQEEVFKKRIAPQL